MSAVRSVAPWIICPSCSGDGKVDHLGVVNRDDFDSDEWEAYLDGAHDRSCSNCRGTGKVREDEAQMVRLSGSTGQNVYYADADDASEHYLRMAEGLA